MKQYESNAILSHKREAYKPALDTNQYFILDGRKRELAKNATFSFFSPVEPLATDAAS